MLFVRLQKDIPTGNKSPGVPDDWPAEVEEVADGTPDPEDGRLVMKDAAELEAYKESKKADYDAWFDLVSLPLVKEAKFQAIDARTVELIEKGFVFALKTFSLSVAAQSTWTGLFTARESPYLEYPVRINTIDDLSTYELNTADDVANFYFAAVGTYRSHLDNGTLLKDKVRKAATSSEVKAVVDNR